MIEHVKLWQTTTQRNPWECTCYNINRLSSYPTTVLCVTFIITLKSSETTGSRRYCYLHLTDVDSTAGKLCSCPDIVQLTVEDLLPFCLTLEPLALTSGSTMQPHLQTGLNRYQESQGYKCLALPGWHGPRDTFSQFIGTD